MAPFGISGLWALPPGQEWGISADLSYHSFVVSNEVEAIAGEGSVQQKERFTRLTGWLGGTVRALGAVDVAGEHTLDLSLGLSYVQLPTLKVTDVASGQAALTRAQSIRFGLQAAYEWTVSAMLSFGLKVRYAPFAVESAHPSAGYGVQLSSAYRVARGQVLDFGVTSSADDISSKSACNDGVDCPTKITSTSRVTDLRVGYRLVF